MRICPALFLIFVPLFIGSCSQPEVAFVEAIRPIAWTEVKLSNLDQKRRLSGSVQPLEATNLSFQVGGKVDWVKVKLGDVVKQGDALAQLDQRSFNLSRQSAQASYQQAQSALTEAKNEYDRYKELSEQGLVSRSGFDNADAAYKSATSAVNVAKAQLDIAQKDLQDTQISAPYDGRITKRLIEPSMQISPGVAAFQIEGENGMEVQVMVPETLIRDLALGDHLAIHYPTQPGVVGEGTITEIGAAAQSANAYPVAILIGSSLQELRAGMTAEVDFTFQGVGRTGYRGTAVRVPVSAIGADVGQSSYVFVYDQQNQQVHKRTIQTENIIDNEVLVSDGLTAGEIVATAGVSYLRDGQKVTLFDALVQRFN